MSNVTEATDATFDQLVLQNDKPTVVDFWATWCGPCRLVAPEIDKLAVKYAGSVDVVKVDVDANPELALRYQIQRIPAVKAFRDGQVVAEFVGAQPPAVVARFLDELTGPTAAEQAVAELTASGELPELVMALEQDEHERAFELLLEAIRAAEGAQREHLVDLTVRLFGQLGHEHPLTMRYRRQLAANLY
jgi:thioredoxin